MSTCAADEVDGGVVAGLWHDDPLVRLLARQVRLSGERVRSSVIVSYLRTTASTKTSLSQRLSRHARSRWPALAKVQLRFWAQFAYVDGLLPDGQVLPLCRLGYGGSANRWGLATYRASHDDYQDNMLPAGQFAGSPEDALDCACGLYLNDPTAR